MVRFNQIDIFFSFFSEQSTTQGLSVAQENIVNIYLKFDRLVRNN